MPRKAPFARLIEFDGVIDNDRFVITLLDALLEFGDRNVMPIEPFEREIASRLSPSTLSSYTAVADAFLGRLKRHVDVRVSQLQV